MLWVCAEPPTASRRNGTGVLWVLTGTHRCDDPPRQDGKPSERQLVQCIVAWVRALLMSLEGTFRRDIRSKEKKDTERATRGRKIVLLQRKCRRTSWSQCNISCKRWRKGGTIMPEHQKVQNMAQKIQSIQDKRKYTERKLGGKRRNAENQRRNLSGRKSASHSCRT